MNDIGKRLIYVFCLLVKILSQQQLTSIIKYNNNIPYGLHLLEKFINKNN